MALVVHSMQYLYARRNINLGKYVQYVRVFVLRRILVHRTVKITVTLIYFISRNNRINVEGYV